MVALGQTSDPRDLVPGDPAEIAEVAGKMYNYGTLLTEAGNGLQRIDTSSGWQGSAADAFRAKFKGQPSAWLEAGSCFTSSAKALDTYVPVLSWAQQEAAGAITQWHAGQKKAAQSILSSALGKVADAAGTAAGIIGQARDKAPQKPGFWSDVGGFLDGALHMGEDVGGDVLNGLASYGNAMIQNPGDTGTMLGGALLMGVSALGDGVGGVLDATGVGAIAGVPVNALSTAGVLTGATLMAASGGDLARHAATDDSVDPVQTGGGGDSGPTQDPRLTPGTPEYNDYINDLAKDPAHGGEVSAKSLREAVVGAQAEANGDIPGELTRAQFDEDGNDVGEFTDSTGQNWDVKSSPDVQPDYGRNPGQPITPQTDAKFTGMVNKELQQGTKVLLDPQGMSATRLAHLQEVVASNPEWQGQVVWGQ
ncbi:MAG TPA: hypothetical protein VGG75_17995 [Trebonia sp.]